MSIDADLLQILACPVCHGDLEILPGEAAGQPAGLACPACSLVYPIRDDIPVMLKEEAVPRREWDAGRSGRA